MHASLASETPIGSERTLIRCVQIIEYFFGTRTNSRVHKMIIFHFFQVHRLLPSPDLCLRGHEGDPPQGVGPHLHARLQGVPGKYDLNVQGDLMGSF